jgi:hypothetical protein
LAGGSPSDLGAQPARQVLRAGAGIARRLAGGEIHAYGIQASPGTPRLITVEQRGIDVEVAVLRPDGTTLIAVDGRAQPSAWHLAPAGNRNQPFPTGCFPPALPFVGG